MVEIKVDKIYNEEIELSVYTIEATKAEIFIAKIMKDTLTRKVAVNCSAFMPIILNGILHYTVTVTGSNYKKL